MAEPERYDAVVVGSGEGGKYLAWHLAQSGQRVAVVERWWIGGSCPNINCLPSKNEIWSAGIARTVARAGELGITTGPVSVDMEVAGVGLDARGYVVVNDRLETSAPDVWAISECAGSPSSHTLRRG